jgi:hypothetical protein
MMDSASTATRFFVGKDLLMPLLATTLLVGPGVVWD